MPQSQTKASDAELGRLRFIKRARWVQREPKMAEPTRTLVAPNPMATS